jgi:Flp pilus assembly protein TadB
VVDASIGGRRVVTASNIMLLWVCAVFSLAVVLRRRWKAPNARVIERVTLLKLKRHDNTKIGERDNQVLVRFGSLLTRHWPDRVREYTEPRTVAIMALVVGGLLPFSPKRALAMAVLGGLGLVARARRRAASHERARRQEFPELVDLLGVAVQSGRTLLHAIEFVCAEHTGELHRQLLDATRSIDSGHRFVDALQALAVAERRSHHGRSSDLSVLIATLVSAERYGVSLPLALHELASDVRDQRRRHGEAEARRVPIRMLGPLVLLLLPSFALLTVAPLLASGLSSLRLGP